MNDDQILLYTIAEILLEVNLSEEKKQRIRDVMCGVYHSAPEPKPKTKRFEVPAISDVKAHMETLQVANAEKSKGWMVGKNKMKNWKSAASRWCIELPRTSGDTQKKRIVV